MPGLNSKTRPTWNRGGALRPAPDPGYDRMSGCRPAVRPRSSYCAVKLSQDTLECQFENVPVGLSFHAHTCSV